MGDFDTSFLLCQEDSSFLRIDQENNLDPYFPPESDDEYMLTLIGKEATHFQSQNRAVSSSIDSPDTSENSLKSVRLEAIRWIVCKKWALGFHFRTAYLSVAYLDHLFSKRAIDIGQAWSVPVSMVACLSLAAKMEECNAPALSRYDVDGGNYEGLAIRKMEVLVMKTLGWKMGLITPFAYLDYFISKFFPAARPYEMNSKATELIMASIEKINLVDHRPSAIAAAAVLAAHANFLTRNHLNSKITEISLWGSLEEENIHSCYNLLQEIETKKKHKTPAPSSLQQTLSSTSDVSANPSSKRRLTFDVSDDQHCPSKNTRQS